MNIMTETIEQPFILNTIMYPFEIELQPKPPSYENQVYVVGSPPLEFFCDPLILVRSVTTADVKYETSAALVGGSQAGAKLPPDLITLDAKHSNFTVYSVDNDMAGLYLIRVAVLVELPGEPDQQVQSTFALTVMPNPF